MKEKRLDYEVLRLIAIVGVVFNHTSGRGFDLYMAEGCSGINYVGSLLLGILCKIAVPLFFLVSGGLLLAKEERIRTVLVKRVLRILLALVIFSGVLYLFWIRWDYVTKAGVQDFLFAALEHRRIHSILVSVRVFGDTADAAVASGYG